MASHEPRRWFLPHDPDILEVLTRQLAVTREGMEAFARWAAGDDEAALAVRDYEHRADVVRRELHAALHEAFVTPVEPEDLYALSRGSDEILNQAKDAVRESEVMACRPDDPFVEMAAHLAEATRQLADAVAQLGGDADARVEGRRRSDQVRPPPRACLPRRRWLRCSRPTTCAR